MKQGNEVLKASLLQFLRNVKRFVTTIFYSVLNASSPLLVKENHHLMLHCRYFKKKIHRLTLHRCYFLMQFKAKVKSYFLGVMSFTPCSKI
jgi:hypothetical protein